MTTFEAKQILLAAVNSGVILSEELKSAIRFVLDPTYGTEAAQNATPWVSIDDKLPAVGVTVYAYVYNTYNLGAPHISLARLYTRYGITFWFVDGKTYNINERMVTHWRQFDIEPPIDQ